MKDSAATSGLPAAIPAPLRGAIWALSAALAFAVAAALIRYVSQSYHPFEVAFFRSVFGLLFMAPWLFRWGFGALRTRRIGMQSLRGLVELGAILAWFSTLSMMPLGEAIALNFSTPIIATVLAALVLREVVRRRRWTAVVLGFVGMLVIVRPGIAVINPAAFLVLLTALCVATSGMMMKVLSRTDAPYATVAWMTVCLVPFSLGPALFVWETPTPEMLPWLAAVGAVTTIGHLSLARAYGAIDASYVQPFHYATLPFAALIGYFAFAEVPDLWTWVGAGIIAGSTLYIARREVLAERSAIRETKAPDDSGSPR
jgi:drug/metabolite transporter (DMT)-like permease